MPSRLVSILTQIVHWCISLIDGVCHMHVYLFVLGCLTDGESDGGDQGCLYSLSGAPARPCRGSQHRPPRPPADLLRRPPPGPRPPAPTPTAPADLLHRAQRSPQHPPPRRPVPPHQTPPPRPPAPSPWGTPTTPPIAPSAAPSTHPHGTPLTPAQHPLHSPQHPAPTAPHTTPSTMSSAAPKASFKIPAQKKFRGADKKMEPGFSGSGAPRGRPTPSPA